MSVSFWAVAIAATLLVVYLGQSGLMAEADYAMLLMFYAVGLLFVGLVDIWARGGGGDDGSKMA